MTTFQSVLLGTLVKTILNTVYSGHQCSLMLVNGKGNLPATRDYNAVLRHLDTSTNIHVFIPCIYDDDNQTYEMLGNIMIDLGTCPNKATTLLPSISADDGPNTELLSTIILTCMMQYGVRLHMYGAATGSDVHFDQ